MLAPQTVLHYMLSIEEDTRPSRGVIRLLERAGLIASKTVRLAQCVRVRLEPGAPGPRSQHARARRRLRHQGVPTLVGAYVSRQKGFSSCCSVQPRSFGRCSCSSWTAATRPPMGGHRRRGWETPTASRLFAPPPPPPPPRGGATSPRERLTDGRCGRAANRPPRRTRI